jgi:hypothetical protein
MSFYETELTTHYPQSKPTGLKGPLGMKLSFRFSNHLSEH